MSFGGANISTGWLAGLGPAGTTTTSRIINVGGKILVVGNTSSDFTIQGFQVKGSGDGGQFIVCFDPSGNVQWVQSPVVGLAVPSVSVVAQDGRGTVNWTSAATSLLTGYTVDVSGVGSYPVTGGATATIDISGLTNAVTYPVRVRGVNATKQGEYSTSVGLRPMPVPPAPTTMSIATGRRLLDISWNISAIAFVDGYTIDINGMTYDVSRNAVTRRITGLLTDTPYTVKMRSYNNAYESTYTPSQIVTIPYVAQAPYTYKNITAGSAHTGVVMSDGTVRMWGTGTNGRLGIGSTADMSSAVTPCNLSNVVSLETSDGPNGNHMITLLADGTVRTWGAGFNGQLGIGTKVDMSTAVTVCNISNAVAVACGDTHSIALLEDGTLRTWGGGLYGKLGIGSTVDMSTAVTVCNISNAVSIACGRDHTSALLSNGTIRTWGDGSNGRLGNGGTVSQTTPVTVCNISNAVAITAGVASMVALLADGRVRTWGINANGQLGIGSTVSQTTPVTPCNVSNAVAISAGGSRTAAVLANGTIVNWGNGVNGQLGINSMSGDMSTAVTVCNISNAVTISCGGNHTISLLADGGVRTWGYGVNGRLGIGSAADMSTAVTPCNISNVTVTRSDFMRGQYVLEISRPMTVAALLLDTNYAFNAGSAQYTGIAVVGSSGSVEFMRDGSSAWTTVSGTSATTALLLRGSDQIRGNYGSLTMRAWNGMGVSGSLASVDLTAATGATVLGYAFGASSLVTTVLFRRPITYRSIACGAQYTAALIADGTMRTWGSNGEGALGIGSTTSQLTPVTPCNVSNVVTIVCGGYHTAALLADGTMRTWGWGGNGRLGNRTITAQPTTTAVTPCNVSNAVAIACGDNHTAALLADGTMRTWGQGATGQLGIGSTVDMSSAVTPCNISNAVAIACGVNITAALLADGTMRTWGAGGNGQLGNGTTTASQLTAVTPCNVSNAVAIACSAAHTAALLADGTMRTWGYGAYGRLGIGSTADMSTAVTPLNISNIVAISCGSDYTAALLADGIMRTWGEGSFGKLGNNSTVSQLTAVTPCNVSNAVAIACGWDHTAALLADGTMRIWGRGQFGQIGDANSTPSQLTAVSPWTSSSNVNPLSGISIIKPSFKTASISTYFNAPSFPLSVVLNDISNAYQPGVVSGRGIAVVGATGSWEYSINSGSTWTSLGAVSVSSAVLLAGLSTVRLRSTVPATDNLTVKAWSGQHTSGTAVVTAVDTTLTTGTLLGQSFSTDTITMNNLAIPAPPVPSIVGAIGSREAINISFSISNATFVAGYTVDVIGVGTYNVNSSPALIGGIPLGTYAVRVRAYNSELSASAYSASTSVTVTQFATARVYKSIAYGDAHAAALLADGTMRTWGAGSSGRLGIGSTADMSTAVTPCNVSNAIAVAGGSSHTIVLLSDGTLRAFGSSASGQLGIGSTALQLTAVTPCNISNVVAVDCNQSHTAVLLADGTMRTWGDGSVGRLGIGSTVQQNTAVTPCNVSNAVAIACGYQNMAALIADGTVRVWGSGYAGGLGNGVPGVDMSTAVTPCNVSNAVAIAAGWSHVAALLADGTMRTWGWGSNGKLGIGSTADMSTAVTPCNVSNAVAIACGPSNTVALLADGTMRTWGSGANGRLGIGSTASQLIAVTPCNVSNVVAITCGQTNTAALLADGTMRTWGSGANGRLGIGSTADMSTAVTPSGVSNVAIVKPSFRVASMVVYNNYSLLSILSDISGAFQPGTAVARGIAIVGATGTWEYSTNSGSSWISLGAVSAASAVALAAVPEVRVRSTNVGTDTITVKAWNRMQATSALATTGVDTTIATGYQQHSFSTSTYTMLSTAIPTPPVPTLVSAVGGDTRITATFSITNTTFVAGYTVDVSGVGTYNVASSPATLTGIDPGTYAVRVRAYNSDNVASAYSSSTNATVYVAAPISYMSIAGGSAHTAALLADGTMRTWGQGAFSQLGIGSDADMSRAVTPCNVSNAVAIACGSIHTAALLADGTMRTWGYNNTGQLGIDSTTVFQLTAVTPCNISNAVAIACGLNHTAALLADGTMRTWGNGGFGLLGIGSTTNMISPVTPCNVSNAVAIACGPTNCTAALLADGTMRIWGRGTNGQLGIGSNVDMSTAVTPCNVSNAVAIACGLDHTAALLADGTMRTWGYGAYGSLGINSGTDMSTAVTPCNISNAINIAANRYNTVALLADGTIRTWGIGANGRLGNGRTQETYIPITPCNISNAVAIACGLDHTATLLADGTMRTWGVGASGRLGIGSTADMSTAVTPWTAAGNSAPLSNISIVKPSFKVSALTTVVNRDLSNIYFMNMNTHYQPGTVPYRGIAVTATTGTWQYSTNSGSTWTTISGVSATSALAIRLEPTVRIRCTSAGVLTVKAWSAQQASPATVTSAVNTTVATATIQGYSFAAATTTITAA
jgi:alpha-tubulin suppressor-like RCC1 family protein